MLDALSRFVDADQDSGGPSLQILQFDRTIELKGGDVESEVSKGHEAARRLLAESGADVLLWGTTGTAQLEAAVAAYQEALKECTRERVPLDWAMTQNNLGLALQTLGERETGTARLEAAVAAYQEALKERTRERLSLDWAITQNNLGLTLQTLGERETSTARLEAAMAAYQEALQVFRGTSEYYAKIGQNNLQRAQAALDNMRANKH